jgi:SnoaL-like domain
VTAAHATASRFRVAVEALDVAAASELLSAQVTFHSPVTFHPFVGRETVTALLEIVARTFEDFRYTDELEAGATVALVFRARVGSRELEGIDLLRVGDDGLVEDFTVLIRPLSGLAAFAEVMGRRVAEAGLQTSRG